MVQQYRLSIANLQVRQKEGSVESATVQELASWVTDGSIKAMEVTLSPSTFQQRTDSSNSSINVDDAGNHPPQCALRRTYTYVMVPMVFRWVTWEVESSS